MKNNEDKVDFLISSLYEIIDLLKTKKNILNYNLKDLNSLRQVLKTDMWPDSINKNTFNEKKNLEEFLSEVINLENLDVLFLGQEAHLFNEIIKEKNTNKIISYFESNKSNVYEKTNKDESYSILTDNFNEVIKEAPYDVIICYDFIEHSSNPPEKTLSTIKNLRKSNGPIYLRSHPYCSRYHDHNNLHLNKAYTHLIFNESEKLKLGCLSGMKACEDLLTETDYFKLFYSLDLEIKERKPIESYPENFFFEQKIILDRIKSKLNLEIITPEEIGIEFIDYVLG